MQGKRKRNGGGEDVREVRRARRRLAASASKHALNFQSKENENNLESATRGRPFEISTPLLCISSA